MEHFTVNSMGQPATIYVNGEISISYNPKKINGKLLGSTNLIVSKDINNISDINIIVPKKVVEVTFSDGDKQKAVCHEGDTYSLEQAVTICLCKHTMGGSSIFNKTVNNAIKMYNKKLTEEEKAEKEKEEAVRRKKIKHDAYVERCRRKDAERIQREKEEQIEIQKEAYIRAMKEIDIRKLNCGEC